MTVTIHLSPEMEQKLRDRAQQRGMDVAIYLEELIKRDLDDQAGMTLEEILEPFHRGFEESGMTEEELTELFETELKAVRAERRARRQQANG